ncbi:Uncharacterised protein [Mycobacterium tuberculosis]|nr:Uncharacterised protein [Mycobacterium tuberculosis]
MLVERLGTETIIAIDTPTNERVVASVPVDMELSFGGTAEFQFAPASAHLFH